MTETNTEPFRLDPARVSEVFFTCLAADESELDDSVTVEGIMSTVALHTDRLEDNRALVARMLGQLPTEFRSPSQGGGGGWSFLNACDDRNGDQWTGLHQTMEQLFQLAFGLHLAEFLMPREMWSMLPGGMPYIGLAELPDEVLA